MIDESKKRLREYIENDKIYQDYKNSNKEPSDFERFCFVHCRDIENVLNENQQLKEEVETSKQYEDYYKDLCDKALKTGGKYIGVIKEIREYIVNDIQHCTYGQVPKYQDLLQILDKVEK